MVRLGFSDGDGYNIQGKGEKGLREAAYLNLTAASSIGKPAL